MKKDSIKRLFKKHSIYSARKTTISGAFAYCIAPVDTYDEARINEALRHLGQDPGDNLKCVYCDEDAETWDHLQSLVKKGELNGYGHLLGNLVPCCKTCNSQKGNKSFEKFIHEKAKDKYDPQIRIDLLNQYAEKFARFIDLSILTKICSEEATEYKNLKEEIFSIMQKADKVAEKIRAKTENYVNTPSTPQPAD